jgi:mono/diheme cytochrome c family protein
MERSWAQSHRLVAVSAIITSLVAAAGVAAAQRRPAKDAAEWKAPARAARKANPFPADAASLNAGKALYAAECLDCHGARGAGDGPGARELKSSVPDLAKANVWQQSDGELFWKLSTGRGDMPGFDDMLSEEERWHVLNYSRATFAPKAGGDDGAKAASARKRPEAKR